MLIMETPILSVLIAIFFIGNSLTHVVATRTVFDKPDGVDVKLKLVSFYFLASSVALVLMIFFANQSSLLTNSLGLIASVISLWLFFSTSKVHKKIKLTPIYSTNKPNHLVTDGPYKKVRHPFYSSYLLNYAGAALASANIWAALIVISLAILYRQAALQEEKKFSQSDLDNEYLAYKQNTGLFIPKLFS